MKIRNTCAKCSRLVVADVTDLSTEMVLKKAGPRVYYPAAWLPQAARASSRNLGPTFYNIPVHHILDIWHRVIYYKVFTCGQVRRYW